MRYLKGFALDHFIIAFIFIFAIALSYMFLTLMWQKTQPVIGNYVKAQITNTSGGNVVAAQNAYNAITNTGNAFYYRSFDIILLFLFFIWNAGALIAAVYLGADEDTVPIGVMILIVAAIISFPLSNAGHSMLTASSFGTNAQQYYPNMLFITDWMPYFVTLFTIVYIVLSVANPHKKSNIISVG